ncbi:hypothetical protein VB715_10325 [Crocosphaera sp. UHCC 0190]|uniref:hypothetical protein n=1 Tax=Crocosphaera sp. UHCC 0190 TaxID=3110246 RepID=UPI002B214D88|nr:hypothetical protein [Crocosphaera sp. UHCC 0190]MEA5510157.1 hypothetical protein [Crocosphaera sp. UHCC 0190]
MISDPSSSQKNLNINIDATNPAFLQGLDHWLQLELISEQQVKEICETHLCCSLPKSAIVTSGEDKKMVEVTSLSFTPQAILSALTSSLQQFSYFIKEIGQGFREELSVRWLLFLGVFLVVTSSGLLAATQWQNLPNFLQYIILWGYTLSFWGMGYRTTKKHHLRLTSKTLTAISWLLIPINFWAMDSLQLGDNWAELVLSIIASTSLINILVSYSKRHHRWLIFINILILSCLNWGWNFTNFPLLAIYSAILTTVLILRFLRIPHTVTRYSLDLEKGFIVYNLFVLLLRGIFITHLPVKELSLGIGILGWLLQRKKPLITYSFTPFLEVIGIVLLFCGWLAGIKESWPWQSTIVSCLAIHFFSQRLRRNWQKRDLFAIFMIGLQGLFLLDRLWPLVLRQQMLEWAANISNTAKFAPAIYSIIFFPYVVIFAIFTQWIYRKSQPKLGQFGDYLILIMTIVLSGIAFVNPLWRSLDLLLSTATLIYLSRHPSPIRFLLIYITNICGILGICAFIYWRFPSFSTSQWSQVFLGLMCLLWLIANINIPRLKIYQNSSRYLGFILGGLSYLLLWPNLESFLNNGIPQPVVLWWFLTPLALTGVAITNFKGYKKRRRAAFLSTYSLILAQSLTLWQPYIRLIGLGIGAVLMLVNSYFFLNPFAARIQIGFTISLGIFSLWQTFEGNLIEFLDFPGTILDDGFLLMALWGLSRWLQRFHHPLAIIYTKATNSWGILACLVLLFRFSLIGFLIIFDSHSAISSTWQHLVAPSIIIIMIIFCHGKNLNNWAICGITWALELLIIHSILLGEFAWFKISIINLIIAGLTLIITQKLSCKFPSLSSIISFQLLPLFFAIFSILWRLNYFSYYTGLITIVAALIGVGVGCRFPQQKVYSYLSFSLLTLGVYEWLIYGIIKDSEINLLNRLLLIALITAIIALIYRVSAWIVGLKGYQTFLNLRLEEISIIAHIHWGIASSLKTVVIASAAITFLLTDVTPYLNPINVSISLILSFYAFIQGRDQNNITRASQTFVFKDLWVYIGLIDMISTFIFMRLIWRELSVFDSAYAGIFGIIAFVIYYLPWGKLGWNAQPWKQISLLIPSLLALITTRDISYESLLLVAIFYLQVGINQNNLRWSYISLGFVDWAIIRFLYENQLLNDLTISLVIGSFILHIAQFDSSFRHGLNPKKRYFLRLLGMGIINITALVFYQTSGIIPLLISLGTITWGLGLKIKAFLYVGTITFMLTVLYQLIVLSVEYAPLKWFLGLGLGILLIILAAIFEKGRNKILSLWQTWKDAFRQWK